jgi:hypothetical protein
MTLRIVNWTFHFLLSVNLDAKYNYDPGYTKLVAIDEEQFICYLGV